MLQEIHHPDRRSRSRSREAHLLTVTPSEPGAVGTPVYSGKTLDFSDLGARIETREPLVLGQELTLEVGFDDCVLRAHGWTVHTELLADGLCGAGIRFDDEGLHG